MRAIVISIILFSLSACGTHSTSEREYVGQDVPGLQHGEFGPPTLETLEKSGPDYSHFCNRCED